MAERTGVIKFKGNPLTLLGTDVKAGDDAPDIELVANDLSKVKLGSYKGKKVVLVTVPSLDTPTCNIEAQRFNKEAAGLGGNVAVVVISRDLPFAQKRWCGANAATSIVTLSDFRDASFGKAYGVLIKELDLLARAIFVVDANGDVQYRQIVGEVSQEPNYDEALAALKKLK
ncbi:MAG: Thiol peroxidase [Phycisphaerae bacterium]|nr:Thiol peroxidase [Phycisphaerae bacterium]